MRTIEIIAARFAGSLIACAALAAVSVEARAQAVTLPPITRTVNRAHTIAQENGSAIVRLDAKPGSGMAIVQGALFGEGTIEVDVRGEDVPQQSFVGVAFAIQNDSTYEAVYLRPFNFRTPDTARAKRAVQYVSVPVWDWPRLRSESPGKYEKPVLPLPDPTSWVTLRLVITKAQVSVYANGGDEPDLVVARLGDAKAGQIGLWVGNNSRGDFAKLRISRATPGAGTASANAASLAGRIADSLALLRLHERAREAHLAKRADWLVESQADSLISVSGGKVSVSPRERVRAGFQPYLDSSTFQAWDDVVPPRIRISPDGRMAYVIVEKRVHLTTRAPNGATEAERTRFAWLSVYEKQGGEWRMTAIASTDRPDPL